MKAILLVLVLVAACSKSDPSPKAVRPYDPLLEQSKREVEEMLFEIEEQILHEKADRAAAYRRFHGMDR